ncbi:HD-GYP domain-containing protein [Gemmatimonadota bacterium]
MKPRPIQIFVCVVVVLAMGAIMLQDWGFFFSLTTGPVVGFLTLLALGVVSESLTLSISVGKSKGSTNSINFLPLLACILLFGPGPTVLFLAITGTVGEFLIRKKETIRAVFNSSQYVFSAYLAGLLFVWLGGETPAFQVGLSAEQYGTQFLAFFGFGAVFLFLNHAAVSVAIALNEGTTARKVWFRLIGSAGTNVVYDILVSPIAIAVALLYRELWIFGLFLIVLPLLFIRYAYQSILQLQEANRDLLTALVKAIETRDPYTSGHSLRVSSLALRIAEAIGLSPKRQKDVETAALLHDIGKIEAVYSEILRKPSDLTEEEREIIESHVAKGVELLEQLSSFPREVVAGVKGHHERVDGKGYPEGLAGDQIPMAARIIKVCDAIDAMLSDRPYRKALQLEQVREQLVIYSGIQFDLEVVKAAIQGDLLEAHQAEIMLQKREALLNEEAPRVPSRPISVSR